MSEDKLVCPHCGKEYTSPYHYEKHIVDCPKKPSEEETVDYEEPLIIEASAMPDEDDIVEEEEIVEEPEPESEPEPEPEEPEPEPEPEVVEEEVPEEEEVEEVPVFDPVKAKELAITSCNQFKAFVEQVGLPNQSLTDMWNDAMDILKDAIAHL